MSGRGGRIEHTGLWVMVRSLDVVLRMVGILKGSGQENDLILIQIFYLFWGGLLIGLREKEIETSICCSIH